MGLSEISDILWQERQLLELLLFKLEEEQLVLTSGRSRWLKHASREVEMVLEEIERAEVVRSMEVDTAAAKMGLGPGPSLRELAEGADAPWTGIFEQHREAFLAITHEIRALAQVDSHVLARGERATHEVLAWLTDGSDPAGDAESDFVGPSVVAKRRLGHRAK